MISSRLWGKGGKDSTGFAYVFLQFQKPDMIITKVGYPVQPNLKQDMSSLYCVSKFCLILCLEYNMIIGQDFQDIL